MPTTDTVPSKWREPKFQAAISYAVYGLVYLFGAFLELDEDRMRTFRFGIPWWVYYALGAAFIVSFPVLINRGIRWLMWGLCILTGFKAFWLCWLQGRRLSRSEPLEWYQLFFVVVAVLTSGLLYRALLMTKRS